MKKLMLCLLFPLTGFAQWQPQQSNTDASFRAVSAVSKAVAWIGGTKGTFVRTTDGGTNWQAGTVKGAEACDFRDVYAVDAQTAYLMAAGPAEQGQARIYKTTDGGNSWQLLCENKQAGVFFDGIDFWSPDEGIVFSDPIGGKWVVLRTQDGGKTWQQVPADNLPAMATGEAAFAASGTSLLARSGKQKQVWIGSGGATSGRVFRSADAGVTWSVAETGLAAGPSAGVFGLWFSKDGRKGIAIGGDYKQEKLASRNVAITQDGGKTWQPGGTTNPAGLKEAIGTLTANRLVAVGPSGTCYTDDFGKTWTPIDESGFHAISCAGGVCWAVGSKGRVAMLTRVPKAGK
ncbi:WD40/YVTN/BNR-like repeat-containing protein [Arsenicibacter rosenii]|uniref:Oxidoreductase n=1 Tax=Arsenicibacter rosenii TaxID=1750698 RepID=A0A1S2VCQ4_9BACT|nr:oxidoreductase [Arsenicibacter rosenii]OIN56016.1 oxidoreductase [Arsenicibacter rosenii]